MLSNYAEYLEMERSLPFEKMCQIHQEILTEVGNDEDSLELYQDLLQVAERYSRFRSNWALWDKEEKMKQDESRTFCHNSLIVKFNQLSRWLRMQGKPAKWRDELGYEEYDKINRKRIGDFACYIIFINSICAR